MEKETKKCPYCGGEILTVAKKCKHCKRWLTDESCDNVNVSQDTTVIQKNDEKTSEIASETKPIDKSLVKKVVCVFVAAAVILGVVLYIISGETEEQKAARTFVKRVFTEVLAHSDDRMKADSVLAKYIGGDNADKLSRAFTIQAYTEEAIATHPLILPDGNLDCETYAIKSVEMDADSVFNVKVALGEKDRFVTVKLGRNEADSLCITNIVYDEETNDVFKSYDDLDKILRQYCELKTNVSERWPAVEKAKEYVRGELGGEIVGCFIRKLQARIVYKKDGDVVLIDPLYPKDGEFRFSDIIKEDFKLVDVRVTKYTYNNVQVILHVPTAAPSSQYRFYTFKDIEDMKYYLCKEAYLLRDDKALLHKGDIFIEVDDLGREREVSEYDILFAEGKLPLILESGTRCGDIAKYPGVEWYFEVDESLKSGRLCVWIPWLAKVLETTVYYYGNGSTEGMIDYGNDKLDYHWGKGTNHFSLIPACFDETARLR